MDGFPRRPELGCRAGPNRRAHSSSPTVKTKSNPRKRIAVRSTRLMAASRARGRRGRPPAPRHQLRDFGLDDGGDPADGRALRHQERRAPRLLFAPGLLSVLSRLGEMRCAPGRFRAAPELRTPREPSIPTLARGFHPRRGGGLRRAGRREGSMAAVREKGQFRWRARTTSSRTARSAISASTSPK